MEFSSTPYVASTRCRSLGPKGTPGTPPTPNGKLFRKKSHSERKATATTTTRASTTEQQHGPWCVTRMSAGAASFGCPFRAIFGPTSHVPKIKTPERPPYTKGTKMGLDFGFKKPLTKPPKHSKFEKSEDRGLVPARTPRRTGGATERGI